MSRRSLVAWPLSLGLLVTLAPQATTEAPVATPVTDAVLRDPPPGDWLGWRGKGASGYSSLTGIDRTNVARLRLAWTWLMDPGSLQAEPLVHEGVMYLPHPDNVVQALDARTGSLLWEYRPELPSDARSRRANRNIALYEDQVLLATHDARLIALDARTGEPRWNVVVADYRDGFGYTSGPIAGHGRVFAGLTCQGETPARCFVSAHDAATGRELWRRETVAGPGDPEAHDATWNGLPYERRTKGSLWLAGSYDPELRLVYWTTASAFPYTEIAKGTGDGALLYTQSILALRADTGAIEWFRQLVPRDNFDLDHQDNPILADVVVRGSPRKVVYTMGKPATLWAFDRESGEYLWSRVAVPYQNIYERIDPETGEIAMNDALLPTEVGTRRLVCPGMRGGKIFQAKAYNPEADAIYSAVTMACSDFEITPSTESASGLDWSRMEPMPGSGGNVGRLVAVSASSGEILWTHDQRTPIGSVLTTGGGLVFAGDFDRNFRAFDHETGEVLWEVPLSAAVLGYPISYSVGSVQYVAVAVGGGSVGQRHLAQLYPEIEPLSGNNLLMVFKQGD